ncbi:MAG: caspase family protein [Cyanobacteria bacterium P01_F01_bin.150]
MARNFAICIGVNRYQSHLLPPLKFAENDARAMQSYLESIGFDDVLLYSDSTSDQPTLANLQGTIRHLSTSFRLGPEDSFWFSFSGHGFQQNGIDFLLTSDSDPSNLLPSRLKKAYIERDGHE